MILQPNGAKVRQRLTLTSVQIAAILGLERMLAPHGLVLVCPSCVQDGDPFLDTENGPEQTEWKIDCQCRERRVLREDVGRAMDSDGDLIAQADSILRPARLSVRCGQRRCVRHEMEIERTKDTVIARCRCAKTTFRQPTPVLH